MSNIEKIRQEIERLKGICAAQIKVNPGQTFPFVMEMTGYDKLLPFLDTLREDASCTYDTNEFTPTPSVNIEDVARVKFASHAHVFDRKRKAVFDWEQFKEVAGIFYGFGKRDSLPDEKPSEDLEKAAIDFADNARKQLYSKDYAISSIADYDHGCIDGFKAGAKWQKEQMMKDAVEGKVFMSFTPGHNQMVMADVDLPTNTKVKLIIVKED